MSEEQERIQAMQAFVDQFPDNPFPRYALAMEHKSAGRLAEAADTLAELARRVPDYVATWLQFGMVLEQLGRIDEARATFTQGIEVARAKKDTHALGELEGYLRNLD